MWFQLDDDCVEFHSFFIMMRNFTTSSIKFFLFSLHNWNMMKSWKWIFKLEFLFMVSIFQCSKYFSYYHHHEIYLFHEKNQQNKHGEIYYSFFFYLKIHLVKKSRFHYIFIHGYILRIASMHKQEIRLQIRISMFVKFIMKFSRQVKW